jgi:hypothetical protein
MNLRTIAGVGLSLATACSQTSSDDVSAGTESAIVTTNEAITIDNWRTHPVILAVNGAAKEIEAGITTGQITPSKTSNLCDGSAHDHREKGVDAAGRVRELKLVRVTKGGHGETEIFFFDGSGVPLSFIVTEGPVFGGFTRQVLVYWNAGVRTWEVDRSVDTKVNPFLGEVPWKIPGASFPIPADVLAHPASAYDAPPNCG